MLSHTSRCKIKRYIYLYCLPKMASHYYCPPKMPSLTKNGITLSSTNKCITLMSTNNDITLLTCNNGVTLLTANNGILLLSTNHGVTIWLPIMASHYCLPIIPSHYCLPIMASHYYCLEIMASHYWLPIKASHGQKSWSLFSWSTAPLNINLDWFHFRVWLVAHPLNWRRWGIEFLWSCNKAFTKTRGQPWVSFSFNFHLYIFTNDAILYNK